MKCKVWVQMERMAIFTCLTLRNRALMSFSFTSPKLKEAFYLKVRIQLADQPLYWRKVKIMSLLMVFSNIISLIPSWGLTWIQENIFFTVNLIRLYRMAFYLFKPRLVHIQQTLLISNLYKNSTFPVSLKKFF